MAQERSKLQTSICISAQVKNERQGRRQVQDTAVQVMCVAYLAVTRLQYLRVHVVPTATAQHGWPAENAKNILAGKNAMTLYGH